MECPRCHKPNPDDKQYCGDCGAPLKNVGVMSEADLRERIRAVLKEEFKDAKVVEVEATEKVVAKITDWARMLGFFAGIPIAILVLVLGALGFKKYSDLSSLADAAEQKIQPVIKRAGDQAKDVAQQTESLKNQSESLAAELRDAANLKSGLEAQIASLSGNLDKKVTEIQGQVNEIRETVTKPGKERWPVKTGQDKDALLVGSAIVDTTIEDLIRLPRPDAMRDATIDPDEYQTRRAGPVELTIYRVEATIVGIRQEPDGDYDLVIKGSTGATMIAEIPDPRPIFIGQSAFARNIKLAREQVGKLIEEGKAAGVIHIRAQVTGVGFFDRAHGATGTAPNVLELHPVTSVLLPP